MSDERKPDYMYYLFDPRDGVPIYVGKTCQPETRLQQHRSTSKHLQTKVAKWVKVLASDGVMPGMEIIGCSIGEWQPFEKQCIAQYKKEYNLLNQVSGGNQPQLEKVGVRAKLRSLHRDLGILLKKGYVSESTKTKLRIAAMVYPDIFGRFEHI